MIAATAIANDLPIYTANPRDFEEIGGLQVVAVEVASADAIREAREAASL